MQEDDVQLEALCQVPELQENVQQKRASGSATRLLAIIGVCAVVACAGRALRATPHEEQHVQRTGIRGMTMLDDACPIYGRMNCNASKCCAQPGFQCYEQNQGYAQCRQDCASGAPDPVHWDGSPWSCKELGARTPGEPVACSKGGEDCSQSQCCGDTGYQCYQKNSSWAACKMDCAPNGPDLSDVDSKFWTCKTLGERNPAAQPWVYKQCSKEGDSCLDTKCCMNAGEQCFMQNEYWGLCKSSCDPKYEAGWSCNKLGMVTPASPAGGGTLAPWVTKECSKPHEGCIDSGCCLGMDFQCYKKNKYWGECKQACTPGKDPFDKNATWSCEKMGPRSYGLAIKGSPSLYCFAVFRTEGYELDLMKAIREKDAGIFACDHYTMFTADGQTQIGDETTTQFPGATIIGSVDGTAGNTELFVHVWKKVVDVGVYKDHAFTVKADPDAVFIPDKLRWHLGSHVGEKMFIVNCAAWNMVYGSLEVFSYAAIQAWADGSDTCNAPADFGEDKYITQCMDTLKVTRVDDFGVVGDQLCGSFKDCRSLPAAAFHPFKDVYSWMDCWQQAMNVLGK